MNKRVPVELQTELDVLNKSVADAVDARRRWLDEHMQDACELSTGDTLYDVESGQALGQVERLYRYWNGRNDLLDTSLDVHIEYKTRYGLDNTSREPCRRFGTRAEAIAYAEQRVKDLR
jgi:hypothetical protein